MKQMPVLFVGHGSPMNAVEPNEFTACWEKIGREIPVPQSILSISAHWFTRGSYIGSGADPRMIYDMYGFPRELYEVQYPAKGSAVLSLRVQDLLGPELEVNDEWGLDHGSWSVLLYLYPKANIPVVQLSVNGLLTPEEQYQIGRSLRPLRDEGVLIMGSGNVVHNLREIEWENPGGAEWADRFDGKVREAVEDGDVSSLMRYRNWKDAAHAVPTPDHLDPLFYCMGAVTEQDRAEVFNDSRVMGSLSMTGYLFQK